MKNGKAKRRALVAWLLELELEFEEEILCIHELGKYMCI